jgi:Ca-activated chloride channel family protein
VVNATAVTDGRASGGGVEADKKAPTAQPGISGATTYRKGGGGGEWFTANGAVTVSGGSGEGSVAVSDLNGTAMSLGGKVVSAGKPVYFDNYAVQNPDASRNALAADPDGRHDTNGRGEQRGNTVDLAGWAESGPKQPDQKNLPVVNGEPMMPLRTELPKPMLAGTPVALPNVMVVQKDAQKLSERLKEVADAPVAGLKADTAGKSFYAWSDEAKKLSEHRKSVDELRSASTATAAAPTTPAPDEQLERGREVTPPVGTVVVSGGNLNFNGGTLDAGYVNGPGAVSGEKALAKAKEAKGALRQEEQAADTSGRNSFAYQLAGGVLASPVSETKPTGEKVTRGLANADDWAVDAIAPAKAPADWNFASKQQELELASQVKVLKGAAKGYGGRFGSAGFGRGGRVTDAEVETDAEHKEAAGREFRAYDARKKDLAALGDVSKMTGKDSDSDGIVLKAGDTLDLGRLAKHERALEETEKTRRLNVLTTDADEKSQSEKPAALKPAEKVAQQRATASRTELGLELREEDDAGLKKALGENRKDGRDESTTAKPIFRAAGVNPWLAVGDQSFSTFSISVDSASFTLARRYLNGGQRPPPESVRTEEFVNYFDYGYAPPGRDLFSVHAAAARTPFCPPGVQLLKLGIKGRRIGREDRGANLTFLLDTSGSMNAPDRLDLARDALKLLLAKLGPRDRVALVTFSSRARLVLDFTSASERQKIFAALDGIQAAGFTHLEGGLKRAYETAARGFVSGASNRVILMSDGVANVGADAAAELLAQVEKYRKQGLFCSVFGLGTGTYDDTMLQALASKGNGSYLFMDSLDEARRVFVDEFAATLNKIASDVKIQVEFNPRRVKQYRQLGYEQRQLKTEDFRNDAVAAGEVGSGQSVTALYQVELQGDPNEPLGTVRVRGRNLETGRVEELERAITASDLAPSFERADVRFQLAAAAAQFAEILRGSPYAEGASCGDVVKVLRPIALELSLDQKVQELLRLVTAAGGAPQAAE